NCLANCRLMMLQVHLSGIPIAKPYMPMQNLVSVQPFISLEWNYVKVPQREALICCVGFMSLFLAKLAMRRGVPIQLLSTVKPTESWPARKIHSTHIREPRLESPESMECGKMGMQIIAVLGSMSVNTSTTKCPPRRLSFIAVPSLGRLSVWQKL